MFRRWELPVPTTVAPLFAPEERRGIYVLEFANGERYVGQAEDVVSRYNSHRRGSTHHEPWLDVVAIGFLSIPDGDLNGPERETIREHRGHFPLRNRTYNFGHWQPSPLDEIINPETQRHWATGQTDYDLQPFRAATKTLTPGTLSCSQKQAGKKRCPMGDPSGRQLLTSWHRLSR